MEQDVKMSCFSDPWEPVELERGQGELGSLYLSSDQQQQSVAEQVNMHTDNIQGDTDNTEPESRSLLVHMFL